MIVAATTAWFTNNSQWLLLGWAAAVGVGSVVVCYWLWREGDK